MRFLPAAVSLRGHTTDALPRFDRFFYVRSSSIMAEPAYMQALKGEFGMMKYGWFRNYHAKYMVKGKFKPAIHIITFVMCLGYAMEYPHLKRASPPLAPPFPLTHAYTRTWTLRRVATPWLDAEGPPR